MGKDYCINYLLLHKNITANWVVYNTHLLSQFQGVGTLTWVDWLLCKAVVKVLVRAKRSWGRIHFQAHVVVDSLQFLAHGWAEAPSFLLFWLETISCHVAILQHANLLFFLFFQRTTTHLQPASLKLAGKLSLCNTDVKILCNVIIYRYSCTFHHFCHILMVKSKPWVPPNHTHLVGWEVMLGCVCQEVQRSQRPR